MPQSLTNVFFAMALFSLAATLVAQDHPVYEPRHVVLPKNAGYVSRDGSISIVGYNDMAGVFTNLNAIFIRTHPGFKFRLLLNGTASAAPALAHGVSAFAPMGAEFSALEIKMFKSVVGYEPLAFRVAHDSLDPRALSGPVGIYVNKSNPVEKLTVNQLARIFMTGGPGGDLTSWGQLGLKGEWANRAIHPAGIAEEAAAGLSRVMLKKMGEFPFAPGYDSFLRTVDVVRRVGEDPAAIGFGSGNAVSPETKLLAIADKEGGYYASLTTGEIVAGKYPLDRYLLIYVRRSPGRQLDPFVKEYLRLIFSREGQQAIAAARPGYLPLNGRELAEELAGIE
jgi:phosphate transport system substrate-binding protein